MNQSIVLIFEHAVAKAKFKKLERNILIDEQKFNYLWV